MEFSEVVRRRRMVRRFDPARPVARETVTELLDLAVRAPSAGFTQGWDFVVLDGEEARERFWAAAQDPDAEPDAEPDAWLRGVSSAPTLVLCCSSPRAYLERYAEPDKGWTDRDPGRWPIPYWDVDTGMASLLLLLGAVDRGLGGLFFGVPAGRHDAVRRAHGIPDGHRLVGVVALGHEADRVTSPSLRRGRRGVASVAHWGRFGESAASAR